MTETYYKVTAADGSSYYGGHGVWIPGAWRSAPGDLVPCRVGLHLCRDRDLLHWPGPAIWSVEVDPGARIIEQEDKVVVSRARVVDRLAWDDRIARLFAADCAEQALPLFERLRPDDDRPRQAIEVARRYARGEATDQERDAAGDAAGDAARAAAGAAGAAGDAAGAAAWDAARAWQTARLVAYLHGRVDG